MKKIVQDIRSIIKGNRDLIKKLLKINNLTRGIQQSITFIRYLCRMKKDYGIIINIGALIIKHTMVGILRIVYVSIPMKKMKFCYI